MSTQGTKPAPLHTTQWRDAAMIGAAMAGAAMISAALLALARWYRQPAAKRATGTLLDQFLPNAEFNGQVSVVIHAPPPAIFQALHEVTLADMPLAKWLGELRYLPGRLMGKGQATP
ncbi:MAG: hypothetical protein KF832_26750, partial [Caldilineaceae bacterium]|nr:hypothetical protein [Caldilineaceae bacterium]